MIRIKGRKSRIWMKIKAIHPAILAREYQRRIFSMVASVTPSQPEINAHLFACTHMQNLAPYANYGKRKNMSVSESLFSRGNRKSGKPAVPRSRATSSENSRMSSRRIRQAGRTSVISGRERSFLDRTRKRRNGTLTAHQGKKTFA